VIYKYENEHELIDVTNQIQVSIMKLEKSERNPDYVEEAIDELEEVVQRIIKFKPIIKINVED
jgi:hypothetical protein